MLIIKNETVSESRGAHIRAEDKSTRPCGYGDHGADRVRACGSGKSSSVGGSGNGCDDVAYARDGGHVRDHFHDGGCRRLQRQEQ